MLKGSTVLVVDDEKEIVEILTTLLEMYGAKVIGAHNGVDAFEIYNEAEKIDAVLTDVLMPGKEADGVSLTRNIRSSEKPDPVIIMLTGFSKKNESDTSDAGADIVMSKPFDLEGIVRFLEENIKTDKVS